MMKPGIGCVTGAQTSQAQLPEGDETHLEC